MRKCYSSVLNWNRFFGSLILLFAITATHAQTTLTTLPNPPYNATNGAGTNTAVTFVIENTNPFPVLLNGVSTWLNTADANSTLQLWYSATSLSGAPAIATPAWTQLAQVTNFPAPAVSGITPVWSALGFTIPAGTQYRFAVWYVNIGSHYSGTGVGTVTPSTFTGGGVNLKLGDVQIAGAYVGYGGPNNPRWWTGAVTFEPAGPCTNPPIPGTITSTATTACLGIPFTVSLTGGTGGIGQTYQWQISDDNIAWANMPGETNATLTTSQSTSHFYRVIVTCGVAVNSASIQVQTPNAVSGTFTINSALPTGGTNFQTFNHAYDYIKCGINGPVTFNVDPASGPYIEQLIMTPVPGASAANTVTFNGNGRVLTFNSANTNERATIKLNGADHIKFNNLVINATGATATEYGFGVQLINDADSNMVNNCSININTSSTSANFAGIVVSASHTSATTTGNTLCDGNVFTNNTITGGNYGITLVGSNTVANQNNLIKSNNIREFYTYGVYVTGTFNTLVDSNTISRPTRATVTTFNGIYFTGLSVSALVTRNTITNPFGGAPTSTSLTHGIFFTGVDALAGLNNRVTNNLLYNFSGAGEINAINNSSSDNVLYYHNTISLDGAGGTALAKGFYQTTLAGGIEFIDNIISVTRGGTGAKYALYYNTATSDINSNRNDLYINSVAGNDFTGFLTSARLTLADWQAASGDDANSVSSNPVFANPATGNYLPTSASINDLGVPMGVLIDILGLSRSVVTPDMGAYEFTPAACVAPPTAGTALVSSTPVCVNVPVQLSLSGNSIGLSQTYQWQTSTAIGGPFTNIGNVLTNPDSTIISSTTLYYRVAVNCGGNIEYSTPVLLTVNPALPIGTYTINKNIPTGGTNYASFNDARIAMACGIAGSVIFNVVSGTGPYNEQLILETIPGTSASSTITFNGNGNTIAFSSANTAERAVIKLRGTDFVTFDSLVIDATGAGAYGFGVQLLNNADSNTINNCTILANTTATNTQYAGIAMSAADNSATTTGNTLCDGNTFSNNRITGGYYGITMVGSNTAAVANNRVINNTIQDFYFYGIYLSGNFNSLIEFNNISRPARTIVSTFNGVYMTGLNVSVDISKNKIHNPFGGAPASTAVFYGIFITGVDAIGTLENIVSNNVVYNVNGEGTAYGMNNTSSDNVFYYHNTISLDNTSNTSTALSYGFYQTTQAGGIDLKNNIFSVSRGGSGNKFGLFFNTTTSTITSNFNNIYVTGTNAFVGYNGANRATLLQWQTATGQDANSLSTNPIYASVGTGNLKPLSPVLDNKGTPGTGITTDIENTVRNVTTPDMGAYEFSVPPCTAPPLAGSAGAVPTSGICLGDQINLSLTGYIFGAGQTYQWQYSPTLAGTYTNLGGVMAFPDTLIYATTTLYYRVAVTCGANTSFSDPVLVTINPAFLGGFYTINPAAPPFYPVGGSTNFESFTTAVAALNCGITSSVFFDVAPGTYTEQIRMHSIAGTSPSVRVTFRSATGVPGSVNLTYDATVAANNYTLKLDSASYVTYKNMTLTATNISNGRVIELANTASFDSIENCIIVAPVSTATANTTAGIYADLLKGSHNVIKGNTISNGSSGIYFEGGTTASLTYDNVIDSNFVNGSFTNGIFVGFNGRIRVTKNTVNVTAPRAATNYGIYSTSSDSAYQYVGNKVNIDGTTTTTYGMYFTGCDANLNDRGRIANNTILALTGNTGTLYGLYQTASTYNNTVNNVISTNTTGATNYGTYYTGGAGVNFHNNSVLNTSPSATANNVAAYFTQSSGSPVNVQNNIFSHQGGGKAMVTGNLNNVYTNYNTFYTTGALLINTYATLQLWMNASNWDLNSIVYAPAFVSNTNLLPDLANPDVWAIHGRGTQIVGNDYDFNNNPRPTTLTTGVPDMGAYEFLPTALPTVLTAIPAVPANGITQTFMYGTDTVTKITYAATGPVPASITARRFSGVLPPGLGAGQLSMYYYTQLEVPAQGAYDYDVKQYYIDPWQGFIPTQPAIKMGRTNAANAWVVNATSTVDDVFDVITDTSYIPFIDKYTGMTDGTIPPPTTSINYPIDSSNRGTRFWVPYGNHFSFPTNGQDMWLYLSAEDAANVTVRVNGTSWSRTYAIPANTVRVSDIMPKSGLVDARVLDEGFYQRGISITSDVPIVAYAHIYDGATSGASMLLPVGVYGYEYQSLNITQNYTSTSFSWMNVITDRDSTLVEITPAVTTKGGRPAGVPFTVQLMRGEIYSIFGTTSGSAGTDLTGSKVRSIPNASGNCYPMAVFSGSTRTSICGSNGDNLIQQVFPSQAWGKKYLTFATANSSSNTNYNSNLFRVMVKDPTTIVTKNGAVLTGLVTPGNYYEFSTTFGNAANGAIYIEADKPVMVAQYMVSSNGSGCPGVTAPGNGDPEMIYISPIEQGIKKVVFYNTNESAITSNYVNVVIPTAGLTSLRIDGISTFTDVFAHPFLPGYSGVRHNLGSAAGQHIMESDSAFTAITYGLGSVESYGYNAGTLVKNLNGIPSITNVLGSGGSSNYTCVKAPFRFSVVIPFKPESITWQLSRVANLAPNTDSLQINPVPTDSVFIDGRWNYKFTLVQDFKFSAPGVYNLPITIRHPSLEGCSNSQETVLTITVIPAPIADFSTITTGCLGAPIQFNGTGTTANGVGISTWNWTFGDTNTANSQNPIHTYAAVGTYNVNLSLIAADGCLADTTKQVVVNALAAVAVVNDSIVVCGNDPVTFTVLNPDPGSTYDWFTDPTGGTSVFTGPAYTIPTLTGTVIYYVQATNAAGCISERKRVRASILPGITAPVLSVVVDSIGTDRVLFSWLAVPNALSYEVSTDNGLTWSNPSSGPAGLSHLVTGLLPLQEVTLIVRAKGAASCQVSTSQPLSQRTHPDQIYIPNAFSPNGDGRNDFLIIYGHTIQSLRFMVFNQWGEKIFESNSQTPGWNGTYKGKPQPSGVYMYVCQLTLRDGSTQVKKGSINLIR